MLCPPVAFPYSGATVALAAVLFLFIVPSARAHAAMTQPLPAQPDALYWFQVGCFLGCPCAGYGKENYPTPEKLNCSNPRPPAAFREEARTWNLFERSPVGDWGKHYPWRGPGFGIPLDSCGAMSGFKKGQNAYGSRVSTGLAQGDLWDVVRGGPRTGSWWQPSSIRLVRVNQPSRDSAANHWVANSTAEVAYTIVVNHGGGHQYRLCPQSPSGAAAGAAAAQNEACFESGVLRFAKNSSTIRFADPSRVPIEIEAVDVSIGTNPAGSAWRKIPTPACACDKGSDCLALSSFDGGGGSTSSSKKGLSDSYMSFATPYRRAFNATQPFSSAMPVANVPNDTEADDPAILYNQSAAYHSAALAKIPAATKTLVDAVCGKDVGLMYYPEYILDGTWPDGFGYYMQDRRVKDRSKASKSGYDDMSGQGIKKGTGAPADKTTTTQDKTANECLKITDMTTCSATQGCAKFAKAGKEYCYSSSSTTTKRELQSDECRALDGPDLLACQQKAGCSPYCHDKCEQWCVRSADLTSKNAQSTVCDLAACPTGTTGFAGGSDKKASAKVTSRDTTNAYFGREYAPSPNDFEVVDEVVVPGRPGKYALSWRWDCEQTPQIWTTCADITIHATQGEREQAVLQFTTTTLRLSRQT